MANNISFRISAVDGFSNTMRDLERKTNDAFGATQTLGKGMTAAGAVGAAGIAAAIGQFATFDSQMRKVAAISRATPEELEKLTSAARDMASESVFSAQETAKALQYTAQAGYDANESISALPGILDLAAASGTQLADTSDILTDVLSAFGKPRKGCVERSGLIRTYYSKLKYELITIR